MKRSTRVVVVLLVLALHPHSAAAHDWRIVQGERIGDVSLWMSIDEVIQVLGTPSQVETTDTGTHYRWQENHLMNVSVRPGASRSSPVEIISTRWLNGRAHPYRTDKGIGVGATEDQVKSAYAGESVIRTSTGDIVLYNYPLLGLAFLIDNGPSAPREIRGRALGIFVRRPSGSKRVGPPRLALIGFSSKVSPGENEALRRALAHAIDKQAVATAVELSLQPLGVTPVPAYSVEHPRLSLVSQTPADIVPRYDPAKARAMFQESRWTGPVTVVAAAGEGDFFQRLLGAIQSSVREAAGAEIVYKFVEFQEYVRTIRSGEAPVFIVLWRATPDDFGFPSQALGIADAYIGADAEVRALLQRRDAAATEKALLEKALIIPLIHY